jgi:hypothetical protein
MVHGAEPAGAIIKKATHPFVPSQVAGSPALLLVALGDPVSTSSSEAPTLVLTDPRVWVFVCGREKYWGLNLGPHSGDRDQKDQGSKPACANNSQKYPIQKQKKGLVEWLKV